MSDFDGPRTTGSFRLSAVLGTDGPMVEAAIVTLLNSDLVGSTRLVETLGDQRASEVFVRHDRLARDLLLAFHGLEIDRTDGFLMLFERPVEALGFALRYHQELEALHEELGVPLAARVGIHLGEVVIKRNEPEDVARGAKPVEVEGLAKPIVTRLGNLAQGGQTLLTQGAYDLARRAAVSASNLPDDLEWAAHGPYRLAGVNDPVEIFEAAAAGGEPLQAPPDSNKARRVTSAASSRRLWGIAGALVVAALVVLGMLMGWGRGESGEGRTGGASSGSAAASGAAGSEEGQDLLVSERVMVIPFENRTGDEELDSLGVIIADWLTQGLSRAGTVDVVPMDLAVRSARFVSEQEGESQGPTDLFAVARETRAGTVVSGAYYKSGDELILRAQITDVAGGKMLSGLDPLRTPAADPIGVLEDLEQAVRTGVASHLDPQLAQFGNLVTRPPSYEAYEAYVVGMERYWQLDFNGAIEAFASAAEVAPEFATPQLVAASAHLNLGRCDRAQAIVEDLQEERRSLAPHDRLYLDWLDARCRGDRNRAVEVARQAVELSPQSSWAQTLGVDALQANRPALAARVLAPLDTDRGLLRGWTAHFFYLTAAWHLIGDHARELEDAQRGRRLYPTSVHAVLGETRALAALGKVEELFDLLREAESFPREFVSTPGNAMTLAALELEAHGRPEAAQQAAEMAVDWYRRRPAEQAQAAFYQEGLARALFAAKSYEEAEQAFLRLAEASEGVDVQGFLGVLAAHRGDPSVDDVLKRLRSLDQPYLFGKQHYWMAAILAWRGESEAALRELRQAVAAGHPFEWPELHPHVDPIWRPLRDDPTFLDFIEPRG